MITINIKVATLAMKHSKYQNLYDFGIVAIISKDLDEIMILAIVVICLHILVILNVLSVAYGFL